MTVLQPNGPFRPTNLSVPLPPTALASAGPQTHAGSNYSNVSTAKPGMPFTLTLQSPHRNNLLYNVRLLRYSLFLQKHRTRNVLCERKFAN